MQDLTRALERSPITDTGDIGQARNAWAAFRAEHGLSARPVDLLTAPEGNYKLAKTREYSLALSPADSSGVNVCRYSTPECRAGCVAYSGRGGYNSVQRARVVRTMFLAAEPRHFVTLLSDEISRAERREARRGTTVALRLNAFSDLRWELFAPVIFERHGSRVTFYDYTKWSADKRPAAYDLTRSASERATDASIAAECGQGERVAVVFSTRRGQPLPESYAGCRVVDGDKSDARYADPRGVIVGLRAKGAMRSGAWSFVRKVDATADAVTA